MKKINSVQVLLAGVFISILVFTSCKKNSTETTPAPANGTLLFHLHTNADTNEVGNYGDTLVITGGRKIVVTKAQLYLSGIQLVKTDGSVIAGPSVNILKVQETEPYTIGSVASGNYESVKFNIGLSAATNGAIPSSSDGTLYRRDMWFDSTTAQANNFIFVNFQGSIDTSTSLSGMFAPFSYKIGTNAHLQSKTMPNQNFTITPNQAQEVHIIIDYAKLFSGVQLNAPLGANLQINTAPDNSLPLATQIANNIPGMFNYEF